MPLPKFKSITPPKHSFNKITAIFRMSLDPIPETFVIQSAVGKVAVFVTRIFNQQTLGICVLIWIAAKGSAATHEVVARDLVASLAGSSSAERHPLLNKGYDNTLLTYLLTLPATLAISSVHVEIEHLAIVLEILYYHLPTTAPRVFLKVAFQTRKTML